MRNLVLLERHGWVKYQSGEYLKKKKKKEEEIKAVKNED